MALSERSRSALYQGFSAFVDEEAVQEMMSFFPARDVEEPVTKEFLRAEISDMRVEFAGLRAEFADLTSDFVGLRGEFTGLRGEFTGLRGEFTGLRGEFTTLVGSIDTRFSEFEVRVGSEFRAEIRRTMWLNVGMLTAFAAVIIAAARL